MISPLVLIKSIEQSDDYISEIYTKGGCYQFYKILKLLYPNATPYKVKVDSRSNQYDHIISKIGEEFYDIRGNVDISKMYLIEPVKESELHKFEKWRFSSNYLLGKGCECCGEMIV